MRRRFAPEDFFEIAIAVRALSARSAAGGSAVLPVVMIITNIACMSDEALVTETKRMAGVEGQSTADLLVLLIEVEGRRLHLALGYSSLFAFCTQVLHLSEQAAYSRITAARAARRFPALVAMLSAGDLTLSSVGLLAPHLSDENADALFQSARHKSTREVQRIIACLYPQPDVTASVRALPVRSVESFAVAHVVSPVLASPEGGDLMVVAPPRVAPAPVPGAIPASKPPVLVPLAPTRYLLKVTIGQETHDKCSVSVRSCATPFRVATRP